MRKNHAALGAVVAVVGLAVAGCAFLLDTDGLKEGSGGSAGAAGTGGAAGMAGTGGAAGMAGTGGAAGMAGTGGGAGASGTGGTGGGDSCSPEDPFACVESPTDDLCTKDWCDPGTSTCKRKPHAGFALRPFEAPTQVLANQHIIGQPTLVADGNAGFYLGFWSKQTSASPGRVEIQRLPSEFTLSGSTKDLSDAYPEMQSFSSSPGLVAATGGRLRIIASGTSTAEVGMFKMDLDKADLSVPAIGAVKPTIVRTDPAYATTYDPTRTRPHIVRHDNSDVMLWAFQGALYYRTWSAIQEAVPNTFGSTQVTDAIPIRAFPSTPSQKFGALVTTGGSESLRIWTEGSAAIGETLDSTPGPRFGMAAAPLEPDNLLKGTTNITTWSFQPANQMPLLKTGGVGCGAQECKGQLFSGSGSDGGAGIWPSMSIERIGTSTTLRRFAFTYVLHTQADADIANVIVLSLFQLDVNNLNQEIPVEDLPINPAMSLVNEPVYGVQMDADTSPVKATAVAMTPSGKVMVVWVEKKGSASTLWKRRYSLDACP